MRAAVGDWLVLHGRHLDDASRVGEIVEVHGADGAPPYVVCWEGVTGPMVVVPGADAYVEHRSVDAFD